MKKITSILLVVLLVLTCLTMAACDPTDPTVPFDTAGAREKLDLYIFEDDGQVISGEHVLPGNIGGFDATWTSSSEFVVLTEVPASEENGTPKQYAMKVGYPETVTEVELTVALSADVTKTFTVIVNPLSVHDFIKAYSFDNYMNTVVADFDLDRTFEYAGKTATIDWSVDAEYADYLEISADGNTCIVYPTSLNPTVKINATFTYNGDSATKSYRMTVSEVKEHLQAVDYWYANTGVGMEMRGYVVEIATVFAPKYGNISLYIVDEDFCAGYYLYRVECDQATADRLVPGAPVIVTGTVNTNYNGLIETNSGGTIVIDDEREALTELPVHALDEEVVGGLFSANYHQSTLVSLTNWKVKEVKDAPAAGATSTLFILEKGGVEVSVAVSKYMEGAYKTAADDAVWSALAAHGIQVGDVVSVTGVLGNYKGHQIMPLSIDGIVKGDTESTYTAGVTAGAAVKAIDKALADNGLNAMVAVAKNVALPTVDGATITAKVLGASRAVSVVDGAIVVAPGKLENACVQIDITVGEFTTSIFRYIQSADLDDAEKLEMEAAALVFEIEEIKESGKFDLPTASIFSNITVTWSTNNACAVVDGNVLTVKLPTEAVELTLTATLTLGEATPVTVDFKVAVAALSQQYIAKAISEAKVGTFKLAMYQGNLNKTLYFAGDMDGYYYATTEDYVDATDIVIAKSANEGFYTLSFVDAAGATKYLAIIASGDYTNVKIVDEAADWGWDAEIKAFYTMVGTDKTYLGTRNDKNYTTMSAVASKYATTNFIARTGLWGFVVEEEAEEETPDDGGETPTPAPSTVHAGTEADPYSVVDALAVAGVLESGAYSGKVYVTGTIKSIGTVGSYLKNVYIVDTTDATKEILVYSVNFTTDVPAAYVNDTVTIHGYITNYNGTLEISSNAGDYANFVACTAGTSTITSTGANATVTLSATSGVNGTTFTFTVEAAQGYDVASVKVNGTAVTAVEGTYTGTIAGNTIVAVETVEAGAPVSASLGKVTFGETTNSGKVGSYVNTWTATENGITLNLENFNNNNNGWAFIKCGRKSDASVASISTGAMTQVVTKVVVTIDSVLDTSKVNSFKLVVSTDADFTNVVEEIDGTIATGDATFTITTPAAGLYYKVVVDCSAHGSKNGIVQISAVEFFGYNA